VSFPLLCSAAAIGVARAGGPLRPAHVAIGAVGLATAALHVVSFGESRFHLPLVPLLAVLVCLPSRGRMEPTAAGDADGSMRSVPGRPALADAHAEGAPPTQRPARPLVSTRALRMRPVACAIVLAALAVAWLPQWQELRTRLARLRAPDGWSSRLPY
jgi:hypothetical protein